MSVRDGRVVLPDGMSYRLLVLSDVRVMTPRLLRKINELVQAGATVLGPRPLHSPSLSGFPDCDAEVQRLSQELWGDCDGQAVKEHAFGKGRVVWGLAPEKVLQQSGLPVDFASDQPLHQIHRTCDDAELYFVANPQPYSVAPTCSFRVVGRVPEFWWPETGRTQIATMFQEQDGLMHVVVPLESGESVFVVFRDRGDHDDPIVLLSARRKTRSVRDARTTAEDHSDQGAIRRARRPSAHARRNRKGPTEGRCLRNDHSRCDHGAG